MWTLDRVLSALVLSEIKKIKHIHWDWRGKNLVVKVGLKSEQALGREITVTANGRGKGSREPPGGEALGGPRGQKEARGVICSGTRTS